MYIIKKKYKKTLIFWCVIFFFSCTNKPEDKETSPIFIDNTSIAKYADISPSIDHVDIIPLMETKGNYLVDIYKVFEIDNKIIAFDFINAKKINLYDQNGQFIKCIIQTGEGKNDAFQINDCWINNKNELEVYDFARKKILIFDNSFSLKKTLDYKHGVIFNNVSSVPNSDQYIGFVNYTTNNPNWKGNNFQLAFLDSGFNITNTEFNYDKIYRGVHWLTFPNQFHLYKDSLRFNRVYDNNVYTIRNNSIKPRFKIVFKNNSTPENILDIEVKDHLKEFKNPRLLSSVHKNYLQKYSTLYGTWLENESSIYFNVLDTNRHQYICMTNKKKGNAIEYIAENLTAQSKYHMILPLFQYYSAQNNEFISTMNGQDLKTLISKESTFYNKVVDDPAKLYIIKLTPKRK